VTAPLRGGMGLPPQPAYCQCAEGREAGQSAERLPPESVVSHGAVRTAVITWQVAEGRGGKANRSMLLGHAAGESCLSDGGCNAVACAHSWWPRQGCGRYGAEVRAGSDGCAGVR
jgi:hypothetical protein